MRNMAFCSCAAGVANANEIIRKGSMRVVLQPYLSRVSGDLQGSNTPSPPGPVTAFGYFGTNGEGWLSHDGLDMKLACRSLKSRLPASRVLRPQRSMYFGVRTVTGRVSPSMPTGLQCSQAPQYLTTVFSVSASKKSARGHWTLHGPWRMPSNPPLLEWRLSEHC